MVVMDQAKIAAVAKAKTRRKRKIVLLPRRFSQSKCRVRPNPELNSKFAPPRGVPRRGAPLGNKNAFKHGRYTTTMRLLRKVARVQILQNRALVAVLYAMASAGVTLRFEILEHGSGGPLGNEIAGLARELAKVVFMR